MQARRLGLEASPNSVPDGPCIRRRFKSSAEQDSSLLTSLKVDETSLG